MAKSAGWSPKMLSQFLAMNAARPQSDFRKTKFFDMLGADALALLTAFLETKTLAAQQFFYQSPWPGRDETTLVPGTERWKDRVREYLRQAALYASNHPFNAPTKRAVTAPGRVHTREEIQQPYSAQGPTNYADAAGVKGGNLNPRAYQPAVGSYPGQPHPIDDAAAEAIAYNAGGHVRVKK